MYKLKNIIYTNKKKKKMYTNYLYIYMAEKINI